MSFSAEDRIDRRNQLPSKCYVWASCHLSLCLLHSFLVITFPPMSAESFRKSKPDRHVDVWYYCGRGRKSDNSPCFTMLQALLFDQKTIIVDIFLQGKMKLLIISTPVKYPISLHLDPSAFLTQPTYHFVYWVAVNTHWPLLPQFLLTASGNTVCTLGRSFSLSGSPQGLCLDSQCVMSPCGCWSHFSNFSPPPKKILIMWINLHLSTSLEEDKQGPGLHVTSSVPFNWHALAFLSDSGMYLLNICCKQREVHC